MPIVCGICDGIVDWGDFGDDNEWFNMPTCECRDWKWSEQNRYWMPTRIANFSKIKKRLQGSKLFTAPYESEETHNVMFEKKKSTLSTVTTRGKCLAPSSGLKTRKPLNKTKTVYGSKSESNLYDYPA